MDLSLQPGGLPNPAEHTRLHRTYPEDGWWILGRKELTQQARGCSPYKALLPGQPLAGVWDPGFQEGSRLSLTDERGSLCLNCLYKQGGAC